MNNRPNVIVIFQGADGWHWRRLAPNGRKQYTSGEPFYNKSTAKRAARTHARELRVPVRVVMQENGEWTTVPL